MKKEKILFLTFCVEQEFFRFVREGMEEAASLMKVECKMEGVEGLDNPRQAQMLLEARERGYDAVALNLPSLSDCFVQAMQKACLPMVGFNDDVRGEKDCRMAHVSQKLFQAGEILGQNVRDKLPDGAHVLITLHSDCTDALFARRDGIRQALQGKGITFLELVTCTDPEESARMIADVLEENPDICAVLGTGLADTQGAGLVNRKQGKRLYVCGFDRSAEMEEMIRNGEISFTIE